MKKRRLKKWNVIFIALLVVTVYILWNFISIWIYSFKDEKQAADVAIVLGAATYYDEVSPVYRERLNQGIRLYNAGYVDRLIVTGGLVAGNAHSDAYTAKQYVISQGIPEEDILLEETSSITQENLENAKVIMDENEMKTAIIVSDPLHMKRAMLLAKDAGIEGYSSPTETTMYQSLETKVPFALRELFFYVGYKWYRIIF